MSFITSYLVSCTNPYRWAAPIPHPSGGEGDLVKYSYFPVSTPLSVASAPITLPGTLPGQHLDNKVLRPHLI